MPCHAVSIRIAPLAHPFPIGNFRTPRGVSIAASTLSFCSRLAARTQRTGGAAFGQFLRGSERRGGGLFRRLTRCARLRREARMRRMVNPVLVQCRPPSPRSWRARPELHGEFTSRGRGQPGVTATARHPDALRGRDGGENRDRTDDTRIFSPLLYQLSYLAAAGRPDGSSADGRHTSGAQPPNQ